MSGGLTDLQNKYGANEKFVLLSVGLNARDTIEKQRDKAKANGWSWAKVFDTYNHAQTMYGVRGIPQVVLVDPEGNAVVIGRDMAKINSLIEADLGSGDGE